ncbi:uncharacterized protein LOC124254783 isoform X1 [Haliotis rubra]|uniref:uncharacterized protein LOC124254783 isoform X1 n=1 Tax=Haliotis rubra TaxID=36100 RepID=UPI001EE54312|nr:uncharacterized protein LOC124254783 isoform X1 [Haliotis rubra]XP_046544591.1 uncharacterized protein LOC124254783 isoform X1 [Haliotis rubra]
MCAARHDPGRFEFVARMGRLTIGTDEENESTNRVPLSFIMPVLPPRQEKLGRSLRASKTVDLPGDYQCDEDTNRRANTSRTDTPTSATTFRRQSSEESLERICQSRKKQDHARKIKVQNVVPSPTSSQRTSNGALPQSSPTPPETSDVS